jgi:hypothetical protein
MSFHAEEESSLQARPTKLNERALLLRGLIQPPPFLHLSSHLIQKDFAEPIMAGAEVARRGISTTKNKRPPLRLPVKDQKSSRLFFRPLCREERPK